MKKILYSSLSAVTLLFLGLGTAYQTTEAASNKSGEDIVSSEKLINNPLNLSFEQESREINGTFSASFSQPNQYRTVNVGTIEYIVPNGVLLNVWNGGPTELSWSAMLYNNRTGKQITADWTEFKHGSTFLLLPINNGRDEVRVGDSLSVQFTNNNFPKVGSLSIQGSYSIY